MADIINEAKISGFATGYMPSDRVEDIPEKMLCRLERFMTLYYSVPHNEFLTINLGEIQKPLSVVFDVKGVLDRNLVDARL